jgi:hypothetical protein
VVCGWQAQLFKSAWWVETRRRTYRSGYTSQQPVARIWPGHCAWMSWVVLPVRNISKSEIFHGERWGSFIVF